MAELKWESQPDDEFFIIDEIDQLFDVFGEMADSLGSILDSAQGGLEAVKTFVIDDINPLILAILFIIDQMISVIQNLNNSGVHMLTMYPSEDTHSVWRNSQSAKILYRDLLPGFDDDDPRGFHILNRDDAFSYFVDSFDDAADPDNPAAVQFNDPDSEGTDFLATHVAGGVVIFAGAMPSSALLAPQLIEEIFRTFCTISKLFHRLFNLNSLKKMEWDICGALHDVESARTGTTTSTVLLRPGKPNWQARKLTKDIIKPLGPLLDSIEGTIQGFKDQAVGGNRFIQELIDQIDSKLTDIQDIRNEIEDFFEYIDTLNSTINELGKFNFSTLVVDEQAGGINILKQAVLDDSLDGRPDQDLFYCSLVSFVSAGTGFSFLLYLLGLSDSFSFETDSTEFSDERMREKYGIETNTE